MAPVVERGYADVAQFVDFFAISCGLVHITHCRLDRLEDDGVTRDLNITRGCEMVGSGGESEQWGGINEPEPVHNCKERHTVILS